MPRLPLTSWLFFTTTFAALAAAPLPAPAGAQETRSDTLLTVDHYLDFETVGEPQISPDGSQIVYARRFVDKMADRFQTELWIMRADGSRNRFFAKGGSPQWSPDGTRIAYLAEGEPKGAQIFVKWVDVDGPASQITHLTHSPSNVHWSPDGTSFGFTMFVPEHSTWKIDLPAAPEGAKWTPAPRVVDRLHYRKDRQGFTETGYTHLFVISADGGTERQLTHGNWNVGAVFDGVPNSVAWDWSPDGKTIVIDGLNDSTSDLRYRESNIYAVDVASGAIRRLTSSKGTWSSPVFSPDGKRIAFTGAPWTDHTWSVGRLYVMNADGSGIKEISGTLDREPDDLHWARDGSGIYFTAADQGTSNVLFASVNGGVRPVTSGTHMLSSLSIAANGTAVGVLTSYTTPMNVVRFDLKRPSEITTLTRVNESLLSRIKLGAVEEIRYPSTGGARIEAWIVKPPSFDPAKKYPLILEIHGGPQGMYGVGFNYMFQNFAANGFVVLAVNPRGSTGYGTPFVDAINHNYPGVDYEDLMAGVDTVVGRGYVDTTSMYVSGCSGGGVLSSWVIGHTNRFAAAAVRCPVIDWISMAGETDIPLFTYSFFAKPFWEDPKPWLDHSSLMYVGNVTTPTLLMTGELDMRTPMPQTEEFYAALKVRGVPTTLLRFAGEYHGTGSKPSNFMRTQLYMMSWFKKYHRTGKGVTTADGK
jgi:dipeptidyl aminopeptidase/acylaminoacyl peptidase